MKKAILMMSAIIMLGLSSASMAGLKYECWTYINSKPEKMVYVVADNASEAVYH